MKEESDSTLSGSVRSSRLRRVTDSPTLMTWLNLAARVSSLALVLPLVLRQFSPGDIALYYLFSSVVALQLLATAGFIPTFARFVSYGVAGARAEDFVSMQDGGDRQVAGSPDPVTMARLVGTMHRIFLGTAAAVFPLAAVAGTLALRHPVSVGSDPAGAWAAWCVVTLSTPVIIYGTHYNALLQGTNRIALDQRWSAIFAIAAAISSLCVLVLGGGLLPLIVSSQIWQIIGVFRAGWLSRGVLATLPFDRSEKVYDARIFHAIWPASWKSFVGILMSSGIVHVSGFAFAQRLSSSALAEFLFAQRIITLLSEFSRAPFQSKIPYFNQLRARGELEALRKAALTGMQRAYASYLFPLFVLPLVGPFILTSFGSSIDFPDLPLWCALGAAVLIERWGAMHIQVYSTTNTIIWHWLNGFTGLLWMALMWLLIPRLGVYAYPLAMAVAYALIYTPLSARKSLGSLNSGFYAFELRAFAPALTAYCAGTAILWWIAPRT